MTIFSPNDLMINKKMRLDPNAGLTKFRSANHRPDGHAANGHSSIIAIFLWFCLAHMAMNFVTTKLAQADVGGTAQTLYQQFQIFGGAKITGNTLMGASASNPLVNSRLLTSSPGDISGIPFDAEIQGAFLFWSGSTLNTPDQVVSLSLPNGVIDRNVSAERCLTLDSFGGFFACRAEVTSLISQNPGNQRFNGRYIVSDLSAEPGTLNADGSCVEARECQAKYAAWSLVVVYSSPSASTLRDITIYDGFRSFDETSRTPGIASYSIGGFDFPENGRASLSYFGMEGDALLGVPPQDTDPSQQLRCDTCFDFFEVNGVKLNDANNPPNNVFNSSSEIGYTLGVDLDTFDISSLLTPGDSVINLRVGSGDGIVNPMSPDPGGGGELFLLSYIVLNVDRNAPNFNREGTEFTVIPDEAAPLERVVFTLRVQNQGSLTATGVNAQVTLPRGLSYFPGSLRMDGVDPVPGQEIENPLAAGFQLGQIPFQGDNDRVLTFRASIDQGTPAGSQLVSRATITAGNISDPTLLTATVNVLGVPPLGQATMTVIDSDGDDLFSPGEVIQYRITIQNPNSRPISGVRFVDQLPPYLDVLQVISGGGVDTSDLSLNRVSLEGLNIEANRSITIVIIAQLHDALQLEADGVAASAIDGFSVSNQAEVSLGSDRVLSDDPRTATPSDPTIFLIDAGVDIRGNGTRKEVSDLNGGRLEPGDQLQFSVRVRNTGASGGQVRFFDQLPSQLVGCDIVSAPSGVSCNQVSGRWQLEGDFSILSDDIIRVTFTTRLSETAPGGLAIVNEATLSVIDDPQQVVTVRSPQMVVFSAPNLIFEKRVLSGSSIARLGTVRYEISVRNNGNQTAEELLIRDPISFAVRSGEALNGGSLNRDDQGQITQAQWSAARLEPGATIRFGLELDLAESINGGAILSNQARLSYLNFTGEILSNDPETPTRNDPTLVSVAANGPVLSLTKSVSPQSPLNGERVNYTLVLRNVGDEPVFNASIIDDLPSALIDPRASGALVNGSSVSFDSASNPILAVIDPGASVTVNFTAEISGQRAGQLVSNQARASATGLDRVLSDDPSTAALGDPTTFTVGTPPQLSLVKRSLDLNGGELEPGDIVRYTIELSHQAGAAAVGLTLIDPIPFGLTNINALDGGVLLGDQVVWRINRLSEENGTLTFRFEAEISSQVQEGQRISNQATVSATNLLGSVLSDDPSTPQLNDPTTIIVNGRASLSFLTKTVSPTSAAPGDLVTWTIELENRGPSVARSVVVNDTISRWLTDLDPVGGELVGGQVIWNLGDLGVNRRRSLILRSRLSAQVSPEEIVANQARVRGDNLLERLSDDPEAPGEADPTRLTVVPPPQLLFLKSIAQANATANPGDSLRYLIVVRNIGTVAINNLIVQDRLPPQLSPLSVSEGGQITGNEATWSIPTLLPNAERTLIFGVRVSSNASVGELLSNQASVSAEGGLAQLSDDPSTAELRDPTTLRVIGDAELVATKRVFALDDPPFRRGGRVRYQIELSQRGTIGATEITLLDPLPLELTEIASVDGLVSEGSIRWSLPSIERDEVRTFTFEARIAQDAMVGSTVANQAEVTWAEGGTPLLSDDPSTPQVDPTLFTIQPDSQLRFSKTVRREDGLMTFSPGAMVIYTLRLQNDGPGASAAQQVTDLLSPSLTPDESRPWISESGLIARIEGNLVSWDVPSIPEGESQTLIIGARLGLDLTAGRVILNQAESRHSAQADAIPLLSDDPTTPALSDPTSLRITTSSPLRLEKRLILDQSTFSPGGSVVYQLTAYNEGESLVEGVRITDPLPRMLRASEVNPVGLIDPTNTISWPTFNLAARESASFVIRAQISGTAEEGTVASNQARLTAGLSAPILSDDPQTATPNDPTLFTITNRARLSLEKTMRDVNGGPLRRGDLLNFELIVSNLGGEVAQNIEVLDPLSPLLTELTAVGGQVSDQIARWQIVRLGPGESRTLTLSARVSDEALGGALITNQFAAREPGASYTLSPEVSLTVTVDELSFKKRAIPISSDLFTANSQMEYLIELSNIGRTTVNNVVISDRFPAEQLSDIRPGDGGVINGPEITWDANTTPALRSIGPGQTVTVSVRARIVDLPVGSSFDNQAILRISGGDPSLPPILSDDPTTSADDDPTRVTISSGQNFSFTKDILRPDHRENIGPGDEVLYRLLITNLGSVRSSTLRLSDVLDPSLRLLNVEVNGISQDPLSLVRGTLTVDSMLPGGVTEILALTAVNQMAEPSTEIPNQATLSFEGTSGIITVPSDDPRTPEPNDPTTFTVGGESSLLLLKRARIITGANGASEGDVIEWVISLINRGDSAVFGAELIDRIPAEVSYELGSMRLSGQPLSDQLDRDQGQWISDRKELTLNLPVIAANERLEFSFMTKVKAVSADGPLITLNQAELRYGSGDTLLSDIDEDLSNGASPTAVTLIPSPEKRFDLRFVLIDENTSAQIGDTITAELLALNTGTAPLEDLEVTLPIPAGYMYEAATLMNGSGLVRYEPAPNVPGARSPDPAGILKVSSISLEPEGALILRVNLKIDPNLPESKSLCLEATLRDLTFDPELESGDGSVTSSRECLEAQVVFGRLSGEVFQDLNGDQKFDSDVDLAMSGMIVSLWRADLPEGDPVATDFSQDGTGQYLIENLRPGRYHLRLKSSEGVALKKRLDVEITALEEQRLALTVEPTGRIYDSVSGELIDGAQLFLYRDEDLSNNDPFDDASLESRRLVPESELASPTQQGQRSAQGGLYRFDIKRAGRYLIEVIPPGVRYVAPSSLVPPLPEYVSTSGTELVLVESPLPSNDANEERRYTLAFEVIDDQVEELKISNNHIPLDPLSALIQIDKRSRRVQYTVGDIVTYEVDLINRSPRDLTYDPQRKAGGIYIEDVLPKGLKYIAQSAVWVEVTGAQERPLYAAEPSGYRILRFGREEELAAPSASDDGAIQRSFERIQRPIDLKSGGHLRLRYQAVITPQAKPMRSYINRARALADGDIPISSTAEAKIQVIADPDFDQGLLIGQVWCDEDKNGQQDEGEQGLIGAKIYFDSGMYAVSDSAGKYHFKMIDPGSHAVKIDRNSLLPGAELTTDEIRVIYFSRGLPAKVDFGVTCPRLDRSDPEVELGAKALREALSRLGGEAVILSGNTQQMTLNLGSLSFSAPNVDIALRFEGDVPDMIPPQDGAPIDPLSFDTKISASTRQLVKRWALWVGREGAEESPVITGMGAPPERLSWDGRDLNGDELARRGRVLSYRLEIISEDIVMSSPMHKFGIGVSIPPEPEVLLSFPTTQFKIDEPDLLIDEDLSRLEEVAARLKGGYEGRLIVDVHGSGEEDAAFLTNSRATALAEKLRALLKLGEEELVSTGSGNQFPLIPNLTQVNRSRNRRVLIRLERQTPDAEALGRLMEQTQIPAIIRTGNEERRPQKDGRFVLVTDIPPSGIVEVYMRDNRGASVTFSLTLDPSASIKEQAQPSHANKSLETSIPLSLGGTWGGELSLGGDPLITDVAPYRLALDESTQEEIRLSVTLPTENSKNASEDRGQLVTYDAWSLITIEEGEPLEVERGSGEPPSKLTWSPLDPLSEKSQIGLRLKLEGQLSSTNEGLNERGLSGQFTVYSPILWVTGKADRAVLDTPKVNSNRGLWRLTLGEQSAEGEAQQRAEYLYRLPSAQRVPFTLIRPDTSELRASFVSASFDPSSRAMTLSKTSAEQVLGNEPTLQKIERAPSVDQKMSLDDLKIGRRDQEKMSLWVAGELHSSGAEMRRGKSRSPLKVDLRLPSDALGDKIKSQGIENTEPGQHPLKNSSKKTTDQGETVKLSRFGAQELMEATTELLSSRAPAVAAEELSVRVPQGDRLSDPQIAVNGKTKPENRVYLNGVEVKVDPSGDFVGTALIAEDGVLEIKSIDQEGNQAKITKRYTLDQSAWFMMALGESLTGSLGAELDGVHTHSSTTIGDQIYVHGRAVAYLKGRMKGDQILGGLFKRYEVTAHIDTAKRMEFESYLRQMIDPTRYYPVYGDSAQEVQDVNSRGPLYVLVKADKSLLQVGNFRTLIRGIELINYDRSLYGAQVSLDLAQGAWRHQVQTFGATQDQAEKHTYVELRGTGGSLYYLPHRELVEGSERVYIVERDRISNMERRRVALVRNQDYSIRYLDGRLLMLKPINSSTLDTVGALPQPTGSQVVLDGHPIFISIEYDHRDQKERGEDAWGAYVRETWSHQTKKGSRQEFSVGGGFIQERQGEAAQGHYRLWGGHLSYQHARKSGFAFEYAKSLNQNAENLFSQDGGLTFQPFSRRSAEDSPSGDSFLVKANLELDDLIGQGDQDWIWLEGYWRYATPGFFAGGNLQQQGMENYGLKVNYKLNERHLFTLSYDEMATEQSSMELNPFMVDYRRSVSRIAHQFKEGKWVVDTAFTQTNNEQGVDAEGNLPPAFSSDVISSAVQYQLSSKLTLLGEQELVTRGDRRLFQDTSDLFVTSFGARYKLSDALQLEGVQSLRWSGDHATQLGIRSELDHHRTIYAQQRFIDQFDRRFNTTVIGGEERFAQGARAFSEYQIESGQLGQRNRAVLGLGKRTQVLPGLTLDASYQRSQVLNNFSGMMTGSGDLSQDALSLGIEWLAHPQIKLSNRFELRYDDTDEWLGQRDKNQLLTLNNLSYQATKDLTFQLRLNYSVTEDELFGDTEAEFMEASFGLAYRPLEHRWLNILFKATSRFEQRPIDLALERPETEEMTVISLIPIFELPYHFQLVEKIAYKRSALIVENLIPTISHSLLWINRINYHLSHEWDIGLEYRFLSNTLAQSTLRGALLELNYIIKKTVRIGAGYNFSSFTDDEFARFDETYGGPFFRVMAQY